MESLMGKAPVREQGNCSAYQLESGSDRPRSAQPCSRQPRR